MSTPGPPRRLGALLPATSPGVGLAPNSVCGLGVASYHSFIVGFVAFVLRVLGRSRVGFASHHFSEATINMEDGRAMLRRDIGLSRVLYRHDIIIPTVHDRNPAWPHIN